MPEPKSGNAGTLVAPAAPREAVPADDAIPGDAESNPAVHKPDPKKKGWIEVAMVDEQGVPLSSVPFRVVLPNGEIASGILNEKGVGRVDGFDPGDCQISFPGLDKKVVAPQ